jgi:hypothetical protein
MTIITKCSTQGRAEGLSWKERRQAVVIARYFRRRVGQGRSAHNVWGEVGRLWPYASGEVLDAAHLLFQLEIERGFDE